MAEERLSKIQKWILNEIYKNAYIPRSSVKSFFSVKKEEIQGNKKAVVIFRTIKNLLKKGIIDCIKCYRQTKYHHYVLTSKGLEVLLNANNYDAGETINIKEYQERFEKYKELEEQKEVRDREFRERYFGS